MFKGIGRSCLVVALAGLSTVALADSKSSRSSTKGKMGSNSSTAESKSAGSKAVAKSTTTTDKNAPAGRLPRYFSALVDDQQRAEIYEIQAQYREEIEALQEQLSQLRADEMAAMEEVLTSSQRKELAERRSAGKSMTRKSSRKSSTSSSSRKSSARKPSSSKKTSKSASRK